MFIIVMTLSHLIMHIPQLISIISLYAIICNTVYLHYSKSRMRYNSEKVKLMVVDNMQKLNHLSQFLNEMISHCN